MLLVNPVRLVLKVIPVIKDLSDLRETREHLDPLEMLVILVKSETRDPRVSYCLPYNIFLSVKHPQWY